MPQQYRHANAHRTTDAHVGSTLGAIRKANLNGRLYPHPPCVCARVALHVLCALKRAVWVPRTPTSLGGWFAPDLE